MNLGHILFFAIKDKENESTRSDAVDSFDRHLMLAHGWNTFTLKLHSLMTSPGGRPIDLHRVSGLRFYMTGSVDPVTIYIDEVRLCQSGQEVGADRTMAD